MTSGVAKDHLIYALATSGEKIAILSAQNILLSLIKRPQNDIDSITIRQTIKTIRDPQARKNIEEALEKEANYPNKYGKKSLDAAMLLEHLYGASGIFNRVYQIICNQNRYPDLYLNILFKIYNKDVEFLKNAVHDGSLGWDLNFLAVRGLCQIGAKSEAAVQIRKIDQQINNPNYVLTRKTWAEEGALLAGATGDPNILYLIERPAVPDRVKAEALMLFIKNYDGTTNSPPPPDEAAELVKIIQSNSPRRVPHADEGRLNGRVTTQNIPNREGEEFAELPADEAVAHGWRIIQGRPPRETPNGQLLFVCCRSLAYPQNIPVRTIVVDPVLLSGSYRQQAALTVGTLAWRALQAAGRVRLLIGDREYSIPATKDTLLAIIRKIINYNVYPVASTVKEFVDGIRSVTGEVLAVSSFLGEQAKALAVIPRACIPVVVETPDDANVLEPIIIIKGHSFNLDNDSTKKYLDDQVSALTQSRAAALKPHPLSFVADAKGAGPALVTGIVQQDNVRGKRALPATQTQGVASGSEPVFLTDLNRSQQYQFTAIINEIIRILRPSSDPTEAERKYLQLLAIVEKANEPELLEKLQTVKNHDIQICALIIFEFALRQGWPMILDLTYLILGKLETAATDPAERSNFKSLRNNMGEKISLLPDSPAQAPLASRLDWSNITYAMLNVFVEYAHPKTTPAASSPPTETAPINTAAPSISAVDQAESPLDQEPWARATGATGRAIYLAAGLPEINADPAHQRFFPHSAVTSEKLAEDGGAVTITLEKLAAVSDDIDLRPCGGAHFRQEGERLTATANTGELPEQVRDRLGQSLKEFRAGLQAEDPVFYSDATATCGTANGNWLALLDNPEALRRLGIPAKLADEWRELFISLERDGLSAQEVIILIRNYVIQRFHYHRYAEGSVEYLLYQALMERVNQGQCSNEELLAFILQYGGGTCMEMSRIGLTMLRLLGLPCGMQKGWVVGEGGLVPHLGHNWVEALLPYATDKLCEIPVEFSDSCAPAEARIEAQAEAAKVIEHQAAIAKEREAQVTAKEAARPAIDRFWDQANTQTRVKIIRALRMLLFIIFANREKKTETWEEMIISQLTAFGHRLSQPASQSEVKILSELGHDFIPSRYLGQKLMAPKMRNNLDVNKDLINLWYFRTRSACPDLPPLKALFKLERTIPIRNG
ncbi:transglutaminase domain-containing protein [Candidatus Saganbacteria bacterium]|nr:transglutaminase domain-containing protein [Candidatus Saganbacteria bacterium]